MFGEKAFDGVGFPTPSSIPSECAYRLAKLPADAAWLGTFMGLIEVLMDEANWQQFEGGITREQAAAVWSDIVQSLYESAETGVIVDVRQNPTLPCLLEKTTDGTTWTTFADLQKCIPLLQGGLQGLEQGDGFGWFEVDDGAWVSDPPTQWFTDVGPTPDMLAQMNDLCTAAANAAYFLFRFKEDIGATLLDVVAAEGGNIAAIADGILIKLFGAEVMTQVAIGVAAFFASLQGLFYVTEFSPADFRRLVCLISDHIAGTDGNWILDYGAIYAGLASAGIETQLVGLIQVMLDLVGSNGLNLAAKTTAISSYDCAAVSGYFLHTDQTLQFTFAGGQLVLYNSPLRAPTGWRYGFAILQVIAAPSSQWNPQANSSVPVGWQGIGGGATGSTLAPGYRVYGSTWFFGTDAAMLAAASAASGIPLGSLGIGNRGVSVNPSTGVQIAFRTLAAGTIKFRVTTYYQMSFTAC